MFCVNVKDRTPIYEQIERNITQYIALGVFKTGDQLPSVRSLAQEMGINPNTVQKAYSSMEQKGILFTVLGKGAFVSDSQKVADEMKLKAIKSLKTAVTKAVQAGVALEEQKEILTKTFEEAQND